MEHDEKITKILLNDEQAASTFKQAKENARSWPVWEDPFSNQRLKESIENLEQILHLLKKLFKEEDENHG
jgi:hypothetical protein